MVRFPWDPAPQPVVNRPQTGWVAGSTPPPNPVTDANTNTSVSMFVTVTVSGGLTPPNGSQTLVPYPASSPGLFQWVQVCNTSFKLMFVFQGSTMLGPVLPGETVSFKLLQQNAGIGITSYVFTPLDTNTQDSVLVTWSQQKLTQDNSFDTGLATLFPVQVVPVTSGFLFVDYSLSKNANGSYGFLNASAGTYVLQSLFITCLIATITAEILVGTGASEPPPGTILAAATTAVNGSGAQTRSWPFGLPIQSTGAADPLIELVVTGTAGGAVTAGVSVGPP